MRKLFQKYIKACILAGGMLMFAGCQATPEKKAVVDHSDGLPKGSVIDITEEGEWKKVDAPAHWKESMKNKKGFVTLEADVVLDIPALSNTPIWEIKQKEFVDEDLEELVAYFGKDAKIYEIPPMIERELKKQKDYLEKGQGVYGQYQSSTRSEMLERLDEKITQAPDSPMEHLYIEPVFRKLKQTDMEYIVRGNATIYNAEEKAFFKAEVESEEGINPVIEATASNKNAGTTGNFTYYCGGFYTESDWNYDQEMIAFYSDSKSEEWVQRYSDYTDNLKQAMDQSGISNDQAQISAEKMMKEIGIQDMALVYIEKGIWIPERPEWGRTMDADWSWQKKLTDAKSGYKFIYTKKMGNLTAAPPTNGGSPETPEAMYYPPFYQEDVIIFVTVDGIRYFSWENMAEREKVVADNTKLLSFDEVKERLLDHLTYINTAPNEQENDPSLFKTAYRIKSVKLQAAYCPAFENPDHAWLVPTWVFLIDHEAIIQNSTKKKGYTETMMINAIDGGFVQNGPKVGV